jgi:hypothetical protein
MHELDEYVLEARLMSGQVLVGDAELGQAPHQRRDSGSFGVAVEFIAKNVAIIFKPNRPVA